MTRQPLPRLKMTRELMAEGGWARLVRLAQALAGTAAEAQATSAACVYESEAL